MNSSESEQSDNENICNEFLFAQDNRYEWKIHLIIVTFANIYKKCSIIFEKIIDKHFL